MIFKNRIIIRPQWRTLYGVELVGIRGASPPRRVKNFENLKMILKPIAKTALSQPIFS